MREDQCRAIDRFDDLSHRERLARPGDPEKNLVLFARVNATDELLNGGGLIAARLVTAAQSKLHRGLSCGPAGVSRNLHYTPARKYRVLTKQFEDE